MVAVVKGCPIRTVVSHRFGTVFMVDGLGKGAATLERALDRGQTLTANERGATAVATYQSKVHATKTALETTAKIFELMGARSISAR